MPVPTRAPNRQRRRPRRAARQPRAQTRQFRRREAEVDGRPSFRCWSGSSQPSRGDFVACCRLRARRRDAYARACVSAPLPVHRKSASSDRMTSAFSIEYFGSTYSPKASRLPSRTLWRPNGSHWTHFACRKPAEELVDLRPECRRRNSLAENTDAAALRPLLSVEHLPNRRGECIERTDFAEVRQHLRRDRDRTDRGWTPAQRDPSRQDWTDGRGSPRLSSGVPRGSRPADRRRIRQMASRWRRTTAFPEPALQAACT